MKNDMIKMESMNGEIEFPKSMQLWYDAQFYNAGIELDDLMSLPRHLRYYDPMVDYVGPENNAFLSSITPQKIMWQSISIAGFHHDRKYTGLWGTTALDRFYADREFKIICETIIVESNLWYVGKKIGMKLVNKYYNLVHLGGNAHFNYNQKVLIKGK